jgi:uncharacterized protein (DUF1501 family)
MNRKEFIKLSSLSSAALMLGNTMVHATDLMNSPFLQEVARGFNSCNRVLVIIQLTGGNDGLNFIIPIDRYSSLANSRPAIVPPQSQILSLNNNPTTGMHPALSEMRNLYNDNKLTIVQGVCYNNPNFSHFRATDIWQSGSDSTQILTTGWLGRYLQVDYPGYPNGYPNTNAPDPLAIQIGSSLPLTLQGDNINVGYNVSDPDALINIINETTDSSPNNDYGRELTFVRLMKDQSNAYSTVIKTAYNAASTLSTQYPDEDLAKQLKIVARLVKGGLKTPVYIVNHPDSFDTHDSQVVSGNYNEGRHPIAMAKLSKAIAAFQNDLELMNVADKVSGMTFSEFGRNIKANGSLGTDHGEAAPVIFFGTQVRGGMIGTSPVLPATPGSNDHVPTQYDYRQLYSSVLQKWLCMSTTDTNSILLNTYTTLPIFKDNIVILPIQLVSFTAVWQNNDALLNWQVANTNEIEAFEVQVSTDRQNFKTLGIVPVENNKTNYQFTDTKTGAVNYYRIVTREKNGEKSISNVVRLTKSKNGEGQIVVINPNPVRSSSPIFNINLIDAEKGEMLVNVYNEIGSTVFQFGKDLNNENTITVNLNKTLAAGTYLVWISLPSGYRKAHKIMVVQ